MTERRCTFSVHNYCQTVPQMDVIFNVFYMRSQDQSSLYALKFVWRHNLFVILATKRQRKQKEGRQKGTIKA